MTKVVHPNSRQAAVLARKTHRDQKMDKILKGKVMKLDSVGEKLMWFHEQIHPDKTVYSKAEACSLVEQYLQRFDAEVEEINKVNSMKGRSGLQHVSRLDEIRFTVEKESQEFASAGLEIPDIMNGKALQYFREWNGEARFVQNIKMRKLKKESDNSSAANGCVTMETNSKLVEDDFKQNDLGSR